MTHLPTMGALDVSYYLLSLVDEERGEIISNLKLQKLLYYCQGYHLAVFDKPLFDEAVVAWQYGPVVKEVYYHFRGHGNGAIPAPGFHEVSDITKDSLELINDVYKVYGQFSAIRLMDMTHNEHPWTSTGINNVIPAETMKEFFQNYVEKE